MAGGLLRVPRLHCDAEHLGGSVRRRSVQAEMWAKSCSSPDIVRCLEDEPSGPCQWIWAQMGLWLPSLWSSSLHLQPFPVSALGWQCGVCGLKGFLHPCVAPCLLAFAPHNLALHPPSTSVMTMSLATINSFCSSSTRANPYSYRESTNCDCYYLYC